MIEESDRQWLENVGPPERSNPPPAIKYHLVVIGAGAGGLVSAVGAASLGAKVALVEQKWLGGDCLNVGCVPSKALIRTARAIGELRAAQALGVAAREQPRVDFAAAMARMRAVRARLSVHDSHARLTKLGIDVFFGKAKFAQPTAIEVAGATLNFRRAIIAAGSRPAVPAIPGLDQIPYLTNENVFSLTELPAELAVIGGGPVGCELAQCFARLGSKVLLLEAARQILQGEEPDAAAQVDASLQRDGVRIECSAQVQHFENHSNRVMIQWTAGHLPERTTVDRVLLCTGRQANVDGLGLEACGVEFSATGIRVDRRLRTTNHRIYAVGDICSPYKLTHAADAMARIALRNALFWPSTKFSAASLPWCTYTDPELAHVGMYPAEGQKRGLATTVLEIPLGDVDRFVLDGKTDGFVRILTKKGSDQILGVTIVGQDAGEFISFFSLAIRNKIGLRAIGTTVFPYPTKSECIKKVADAYNRNRLTPRVRKWLSWWFREP